MPEITITPGQRIIMETVLQELFPQIDALKNLMVDIQACRISYKLYSLRLAKLEKKYSQISLDFFRVVKKLETPDILFKDVKGGENNIMDYFQFQSAFKQNIAEGITYVEIIDRTLDRKLGVIQNNRTLIISLVALISSLFSIFILKY